MIAALCVAISCIGTLNASTYTTSRLIHVVGSKHSVLSYFGQLHPQFLTPARALVLHGLLSSIMVMVGTFSGLIMFSGMIEWSWYFVSSSIFGR